VPIHSRYEAAALRYQRQVSRYPTAAAIGRLSAELGLAKVGQDWDIEAADAYRVAEFLDYYDSHQLNDDERFALMSLVVASYDDRLPSGQDGGLEGRIVARLQAKFGVLNYLVQYWALPDEDDPENTFKFTPIARRIMEAMYGDRERWPRTPFASKRAENLLAEQGVYDSVEIANNRDGTFELSWSKIAGRDFGSQEFPSIDEATQFAWRQLGIPPGAWSDIK
jgi:hypothetical protein